jgi:hypothetical protein
MSGNDGRDSSSFSESIPLVGAMSSGDDSDRRDHSTATVIELSRHPFHLYITQPSDHQDSDQEGHHDDSDDSSESAEMDVTDPPLGVKLTVY